MKYPRAHLFAEYEPDGASLQQGSPGTINKGIADPIMDGRFEPTRNSNGHQSLGTNGNILRQASSSLNVQSKFKSEKPSLSYADLHYEITKNEKDIPRISVGNHQKRRVSRKTSEVDELVKYMSKLPSYLERGKNLQEKALNVGVLDWGRLEKWQYSHKQMPCRSSRYSPSSSNTTSCFSTDESSTHSSRGHSCSPAHPRMRRPSLESHFMTSPLDGDSENVNSFRERVGKFQDLKADQSNTPNGSEKFIGADKSFCNNHIDIKVAQCKRKDSDPKSEPEKGNLQNSLHSEMATHLRVKKKTQDGESTKKTDKPQQAYSENFELNIAEGCNKVVLLLPTDIPECNHSGSGVSHISYSKTLLDQRAAKTTRRSLPERPKEACLAELNSGIPHSCRFPSEVDRKHFRVKHLGSTGAASGSFQSNTLSSASQSATTRMSPSRVRTLEEKKTIGVSMSSTVNVPHKGSDLKPSKVTAEKVRSSSPFGRLSIGMGKMSKTSSSKEALDVEPPSSTTFQARPGLGNNLTYAFLDTSDSDNPSATARARSSPLRRLLDPLLKPKVANCRSSVEPLENDSISTNKACKSSKGQVESLSEQPGKVKLGMTGCRETNVYELSKDKKNRPSAVQALLRVAVKNGLPLFTFAVDKDIDILAATMKKLNTSRKGDCGCIYTFFSIREVKKKNGTWLSHGSKGKGHEYVRNVVAQMKVSDSQFPSLIRLDQFSVREFVLFSVNLRQADCQTSDFQPNDELAATVIKIPKKKSHSDTYSDLPAVGSEECLSKMGRHSYSAENIQGKPFVGSQGFISTAVILPSGAHTLPSNGGPSSLIERWSTGGSCDCGGWDLGCKLRILDNQNQASENLTSRKVCSITDRFELCHRGGLQENQPVFSLAPFKDGIYSVEFNSSLSVLQAFSICIAVLDSWKLCEFSESKNLLEDKTFEETKVILQDDGISDPNQVEGEVPARYVSYPPLSPVGRV